MSDRIKKNYIAILENKIPAGISKEEAVLMNKEWQEEKDKLLIICSLQGEKKFQRFGIIPSDASHKNPLNLPADMTFGVELEAEGEYAKYIEVVKNILDGWEVKGESTLENGVEITSPPLHDKERDINELSTVCMIMNKFGLYSNDDCGRTYTF